jgi:hypothetical protein
MFPAPAMTDGMRHDLILAHVFSAFKAHVALIVPRSRQHL